MGRSKKRINGSLEYQKAYSILEKLSKYDEEKDERVVSVYTAALEMTKLLENVKSLEDKINHQRYHIKKLEHQKKDLKAKNSEMLLNHTFGTQNWHKALIYSFNPFNNKGELK